MILRLAPLAPVLAATAANEQPAPLDQPTQP
jgi:hypothetical protein